MDKEVEELIRKANEVDQDIARFVRHCAMRYNVYQDFVEEVIKYHFK